MNTIPLTVNGLTELPHGMIASIATMLEMKAPPKGFAPMRSPFGYSLERLKGADVDRYLTLYRDIGGPWLWYSRLILPEDELRAILDDPRVEAYAMTGGGRDVGILELDNRVSGETELAFLGLTPKRVGAGFGRYLMSEAINRAFMRGIRRLWVHTCTLDHPKAIDFYKASGFEPYAIGIEIADDPRVTGLLPRDTAPHVPIIAERVVI
ncbi:GNAT family N-acetyltransferase [Tepidamorphus sp. 3E244]|uniref:GNAT family N-acetyltransferase n=1 Tax=Tepidamorphus sp. 3E244 TaxID=3385498 RepID=UPI0038FC2A8E